MKKETVAAGVYKKLLKYVFFSCHGSAGNGKYVLLHRKHVSVRRKTDFIKKFGCLLGDFETFAL